MNYAVVAILFAGILTLWIPERWAWSLVQCGVFAAAAIRLPKMRAPRTAGWILTAASAWPLVQLAAGTTVSRGQTWLQLLDWWTFAILFCLAADVFKDRNSRDWFLRATVLGCTLLVVISVVQKYSAQGRVFWVFPSGYSDDVLGPFVNRNQFSAWIELLFPIALWLAATARRGRSLYGVAAAAMLSSVVASASRAGFVLIVLETSAVGLLLTYYRPEQTEALGRKAAAFAALAAAAILVMGYQGLLGRLQAAGSENLRLDAVRASVQMVIDRPWLGSGLGTWPQMYPQYAGFDAGVFMNQAHNDWAQWAAEGGLPFVSLLIIFAALLWKSMFRSIYGVGTIAFLLHGLVDYPLQQRPALAAFFFAVAGVVSASGSARRKSKNNDVLRGVGNLSDRLPGGDPASLQTACTAGTSRPLRR